jgi:spermidine synthase
MTHFTMPIRGEKLSVNVQVRGKVFHTKTDFQEIDIYDTEVFGKLLLLDGHIQLTEMDEHAYHEGLVQIPMLSMASPKRALVVGGGDGGVLRELCKHPSIEHVDMVEIDRGVVDASKEHLPFVSAGAFDDPRVALHIEDAFAYVNRVKEPYDLIVVDSTDVYEGEEGNLSEMLFTEGFYKDVLAALAPEGFVVTQADNLVFCPYSMEEILDQFGKVFPKVGSYQAIVPSFGGFSGYCWASKGAQPVQEMPQTEIDLRYLNPVTWALAFSPLCFA